MTSFPPCSVVISLLMLPITMLCDCPVGGVQRAALRRLFDLMLSELKVTALSGPDPVPTTLGNPTKCGLPKCRLAATMVGRLILTALSLVLILWAMAVMWLVTLIPEVKAVRVPLYSVVSTRLARLVLLLTVRPLRTMRLGRLPLISPSSVCVVASGRTVWLAIMRSVWPVFTVRLPCRRVRVLVGLTAVIMILSVMFPLCRCRVLLSVTLLKGPGESPMFLAIMFELLGPIRTWMPQLMMCPHVIRTPTGVPTCLGNCGTAGVGFAMCMLKGWLVRCFVWFGL